MMVVIGTPGAYVFVLSLNALQKSIDLMPFWPNAGPTGGVGAAFWAGMMSLMVETPFAADLTEADFDIFFFSQNIQECLSLL